jgi:starch-binding outer membrane protein, SusD/RagB family
MKHTKFYFIFIIVSALSVGCGKDFLDRSSLTALSENNFWKDEKDAQLGINGVYAALQARPLYSGNLNAVAGIPIYDGLGDNAFGNYKWEGPGLFMEGNLDPSHFFFNNFWTALYVGIARANLAVQNIERMSTEQISPAAKANYLAQAKFLRALFYFNIAVYYEDAPLILKVQTLEEAFVPKNTYAEIRDAIIKDLTEAAADLPVRQPNNLFGYATRGAALGLLARFQLYNGNYAAVLEATEPMMSMGYGLFNNYANLFTQAGELANEIVFSVRFEQNAAFNSGEMFSATFLGIPKVNVQPMRNLVRDYYCTDGLPITSSPLYNPNLQQANRDPRLTASIYFRNDIFLVDLNRAFQGNTATTFGQRKYIRNQASPEGIGVGSPGGQDFYVIRYADVLLMRAEALAELGRQNEAYPLVNQVRARVSMPSVESVEGPGLSKDAMIAVIRHERRVELALEGLRFFDLKRWGQMQAAVQRAFTDPVAPYNPVYNGRRSEVFPIPLNEIDVNPNLVQNPVWN